MLSRSAERLYWFARYTERAENTARLMLVHHQLVLDLPANIRPGWGLLVDVMGANEDFDRQGKKMTEKNAVAFIFGNRDNPGSIICSLAAARENIRTTREVVPSDTWERINSLYLSISRRGKQELPRSVRHKILNDTIQRCQQITGMLSGTMNHGEAYQFIRIGRNLERADMTTRIIDVGSSQLASGPDNNPDDNEDTSPYMGTVWVSVLNSLSAHQMYIQHVRNEIKSSDVLNFLLNNVNFPRSVNHALEEITSSMHHLPRCDGALASIDLAKKKIAQSELNSLQGKSLHDYIDTVQLHLEQIHESIFKTWFDPDMNQ